MLQFLLIFVHDCPIQLHTVMANTLLYTGKIETITVTLLYNSIKLQHVIIFQYMPKTAMQWMWPLFKWQYQTLYTCSIIDQCRSLPNQNSVIVPKCGSIYWSALVSNLIWHWLALIIDPACPDYDEDWTCEVHAACLDGCMILKKNSYTFTLNVGTSDVVGKPSSVHFSKPPFKTDTFSCPCTWNWVRITQRKRVLK